MGTATLENVSTVSKASCTWSLAVVTSTRLPVLNPFAVSRPLIAFCTCTGVNGPPPVNAASPSRAAMRSRSRKRNPATLLSHTAENRSPTSGNVSENTSSTSDASSAVRAGTTSASSASTSC